MADTSEPGPQGRERAGSPDQWHGPSSSGPTAECCGLPLFPPGPSDQVAWASVLAADASCAPSFARSDAAAAIHRFAALLPADKAEAILCRTGGMARESLLETLGSETGGMVVEAQALTQLRDLADGLAQRTRALRLLGNGVFPLAAAHAWRALASAHGLGPVDMDAACESGAQSSNESVLRSDHA